MRVGESRTTWSIPSASTIVQLPWRAGWGLQHTCLTASVRGLESECAWHTEEPPPPFEMLTARYMISYLAAANGSLLGTLPTSSAACSRAITRDDDEGSMPAVAPSCGRGTQLSAVTVLRWKFGCKMMSPATRSEGAMPPKYVYGLGSSSVLLSVLGLK